MIRTLKCAVAALLGGILLAPAAPAEENYADYGVTKGWQVLAISQDGAFMRCSGASETFPFTLDYSAEGWVLTVDPPAGQPDEVNGTVDVDRASFEGTFYPLSNERYGMFMEDGLVEAIRTGSRLAVEINGEVVDTELKGSSAAMTKIEECTDNGGVPPKASKAGKSKAAALVESDAARMDATCPDVKAFPSVASDESAQIEFINASDIAISIYWVDFDGKLVDYAGTLPGESVTLDSFVGHNWIGKDFNGTCHSSILTVYPGKTSYEMY
jgi:hypothetical protein